MLIDVNGCEMYLEERGEGKPLLLLHGGTGIGADWSARLHRRRPGRLPRDRPRPARPRPIHEPGAHVHLPSGRARCVRAARPSRHPVGQRDRPERRREDAASHGDAAARAGRGDGDGERHAVLPGAGPRRDVAADASTPSPRPTGPSTASGTCTATIRSACCTNRCAA